MPLEIRKKVSLVHDTRKSKIELNFPVKPNTILYKGIGVSSLLLKHIRHSFAHACIERDGEYYIINSQVNSKCQICGKVKRTDLMDLVNGILSTKKENNNLRLLRSLRLTNLIQIAFHLSYHPTHHSLPFHESFANPYHLSHQ